MSVTQRHIVLGFLLLITSYAAFCQYKNVPGIDFIKAGDRVSGFVDFSKPVNISNPDFDSARYYYIQGSEVFLADKEEEQFTEVMTKYGWTYSYAFNYEASYHFFDSIYRVHENFIKAADTAKINFFSSWAWASFSSSRMYDAYQKYGQVIEYLQKLNFSNHWMVVNAHRWRGTAARQFGMYQVAKSEYLKVLEMSKDFPAYRNWALNSLAILARIEGDLLKAETYYEEILTTDKSPQIANNLAYLYVKMGKYSSALTVSDSLLNILPEQYGEKVGGIHSAIYNTKGDAYIGLEDFKNALRSYENSLSVNLRLSQPISVADVWLRIADCKTRLRQNEEARSDLAKAHKIIFGQANLNPLLTSRYFSIASKLAENSIEGITYLDSALLYFGYARHDSIDHIVNKVEVTNLLLQKTRLQRAALEADLSGVARTDVDHSFAAAIDLIKLSYQSISTNESKAELMTSSQRLVDDYLNFVISEPSLSYEDVFKLFEFNKSNQLIQALNDRELSSSDSTYTQLAEIEVQIDQLNEDGSQDSLLIELTLQRDKLSSSIDRFGFGSRAASYSTTLRDVEQLIGRSGGYYEYFVGPENTYLFSITRGRPTVHNLGATDSLSQLANDFREAILAHDFNEYTRLGLLLMEKLMPDYLQTQPLRMVVIPDGFISGLSFDVLPVSSGTNYLDTRYMVQQSSISVHYSSGMYLSEYNDYEGEQLLAGFAPLATSGATGSYRSGSRFNLSSLPYSGEEVAAALEVLKGVSLVNNQATESSFKGTAPDYSIIHIATHNIPDPFAPGSSTLVFANDSIAEDDGLLQISEVQMLRLNANLVNLSACNSGVGEYVVGEGMMSLARGFIFAGARNVVMSKWLVDDRSTSKIMEKFYAEYKESSDAGNALRQAKLQYLDRADEITADPYYWGAWVHVGPAERNEGNYRNVLLILLILLGGLIFYRVLIKGL